MISKCFSNIRGEIQNNRTSFRTDEYEINKAVKNACVHALY